MRRRLGIAGIERRQLERSAFEDMGRQLREEKLQQMKEQMETFKTSLEQFALNYKEQIRKNPVFRAQFHNMCSTIGVDPLASNKGVWTQLLGFGDFYYQIGVQVLEACLATRAVNGGLLDMESLLRLVQRRRGSAADPVSYDDLEQAIRKLSTLGGGVGIVKVGGRKMVQSVPRELNRDKDHVLELAEDSGFLSKASLMEVTKWTEARTRSVLEELLKEQLALLDLGDPGGTELYWFPCFRREE